MTCDRPNILELKSRNHKKLSLASLQLSHLPIKTFLIQSRAESEQSPPKIRGINFSIPTFWWEIGAVKRIPRIDWGFK
ncbi:hypothetical protein A2609_00610 [Candidatus Kaiserbacteria bacterium RIFOXYD1_FULL_47_14]|uniref:Uncharacterized protein n=1 Tax=Candidatus Kaiserbacteria bacterium RIFOXYD1_FULL_47_14 TaxID=1798533 RepID=A0A1F6G3J8_9BACT|nr:MAG: hypothetical protein A2609_00610 [Candidatus Kaiserbacteria bacterium RIFOXYD1_FULL_47_14]